MNSDMINGLFSFIKASPTAFHATAAVCRALEGYTELKECEKWALVPGGKYYVTRNQSSVIAFQMPEGAFDSFQLIASHSDSPAFKIKENAEINVRGKYIQLDVERYGGMIFSSWFDRPLSVAGRLAVRTEKGIEAKMVDLDRDTLIIPNVAIHMNRDVNSGYKYNAAVDLMPLWGSSGTAGSFKKQIANAAGVAESDILGSDLYLYNRMEGRVWGAENEYISCGRLDDLECAYASVMALMGAKCEGHVNVMCVFDNEEVGSGTRQGADSTFLYDTLRRIVLASGGSEEDYLTALASSIMLSADNAHATHPNHPEYADPLNQVFMNEGVVIKFNANQKYTTDGISEAVFHEICRRADVPVQHFTNRSDLVGGSTLGNISGSHVSVSTLDIGLAQLAMHSSYETAGYYDVAHMVNAMREFYNTGIRCTGDGQYII